MEQSATNFRDRFAAGAAELVCAAMGIDHDEIELSLSLANGQLTASIHWDGFVVYRGSTELGAFSVDSLRELEADFAQAVQTHFLAVDQTARHAQDES